MKVFNRNNETTRENNEKCGPKRIGCSRSSSFRFIALIFIAFAVFLYSTNYNMPGSMETVTESTFSLLPYEFEYMYSVYSLPNVILCFFSGLLIDNVFGLYIGSFIFGTVSFIGQGVISAGGFCHHYWLMLLGRFINGIGGESVYLSLICFLIVWFRGRELGFVFGLFVTLVRLGSLFAYLMYKPLNEFISNTTDHNLAYGISLSIYLIMSFITVVILIIISYFTKIVLKKSGNSIKETGGEISLSRILEFPPIYWTIVLLLAISENVVLGFIDFSQELYRKKYDSDRENMSFINSIFDLMCCVSLLAGIIVDKIGYDLYILSIGFALGLVSQIIMALTSSDPLIPIVLYSVFFSILHSVAWPMISRVVKPYQLATAYGILMCFINLVGAVNIILVGYLLEFFGPNGAVVLFICSLTVGFMCCMVIWLIDKRSDNILNLCAIKRLQMHRNV